MFFVIFDRVLIYSYFNSSYTGTDDMVMWQGAYDYMHGNFYAPYFYGQNYNVMLDCFFAIPFLLLDIPFHTSLFIATSFTALFPFFIFSFVLYRRKYTVEAFAFLIIPLLLPIEYGILTSISRGFVGGLFFTGFFVFPLLNPEKKSCWIIAAFAASMGHFVNPNLIIVSFPVFVYLLLINFKKVSFYLITLISAVPAFFLMKMADDFYLLHPDYICNPKAILSYDLDRFIKSFDDLDFYFSYLTPLTWFAGWLILPIGFVIGIILIKKNYKKATAIILGVLFILFTLGISKIHQASSSLFYSATRMYLGVPIFTGIIFFWVKPLFSKIPDKQLKLSLVCITICVFMLKSGLYSLVVQEHTKKLDLNPVAINKIKSITCECDSIKKITDKHQIDLVVTIPTWDTLSSISFRQFLSFGCPLMKKKFPTIIMNVLEARVWLYNKESESVRKNILFYGGPNDIARLKAIENCEILNDRPSSTVYIIKNNTLRLDSLLHKLHVQSPKGW